MTYEWMREHAPEPFSAVCVHCGQKSSGAVVVGHVDRPSGPPVTLYACPDDAVRYDAGPSPFDMIL
ncbi:hypothetical protein [Streptomyces sp. CAU 1734]|uniref:hypothetical protein n=1 Tax=Streptomyces sp. CAU 1734 TaxID=3140360 RepID=UPI003260D100